MIPRRTARFTGAMLTVTLIAGGSGLSSAADPAAPEPPAVVDPASAPAPAAPATDPSAAQREMLFDTAFNALTSGNLELAEQAFAYAAALPGDPAHRAVALSFVERVRRLRVVRARARAASPAQPAVDGEGPAARRPARDSSGRAPLLLTTTGLGLAAYGWSLPGMLGITFNMNPRTAVGLYMLAASSAFVIPYMATRERAVSAGQFNLAFYGGTRGAYLGVLMAALLAGDVNPDKRYPAFSAGVLVGSVAGLWSSYQFARTKDMTAGQARTMAFLGDFGLGFGFGTGFLLDFDRDDKTPDQRATRMAGAGLLGAAAGLTGGYILARRRDNSWGDGEVMRMATILGAWSAFTIAYVADAEKKPAMAAVMAGGLLGLGAGDRLVVGTDFSVGQSILVDLSAVAGGLAAAGTLYLFSPIDWSERPFLLISAAGGIAGFGVSYWALRDRADNGATAAVSRAAGAANVSLLPLLGRHGERGLSLAGTF